MMVVWWLLSLFSMMDFSMGEVYSSVQDMKAVFDLETSLVNVLVEYANKVESKLNRIKRYLAEFERTSLDLQDADNEEERMERLAGNPIHAYNLIKRFNIDLKNIEADIKEDDWKESSEAVQRLRLGSVVPKEEDLHGSAQSLIRLQDVYELDIGRLAHGRVGSMDTLARLTAQDCLFIGKHCYNGGALSRSIEWFEEAWMLAYEEKNTTVSQDQVQQFLDHAAKEHDERVLNGERSGNLFPKPVYEEPPVEQRNKLTMDRKQSYRVAGNYSELGLLDSTDDANNFAALCRGEQLVKTGQKLWCYFDTRKDPWFYIQPMKVEELHKTPNIWMFHEMLNEQEIIDIKNIAKPLMARSQVQGSKGGTSEVSTTRTSKTGWLQDSFSPVVSRLGRRVGFVSGLNTDTVTDDAELLQMSVYMNGGHYNPHHDYVMKERNKDHMIYLPEKNLYIGDRIATFMFYLNQVGSGGRTVFPRIGASVTPVKGSGVFWYNLLPSGDADQLTLHGACPVLFGTKWVANKWIREGAQMKTRPCRLDKDALE